MRGKDTDNRWTMLASLAHAAATVTQVVMDRKRPESNAPGLHERVALLEHRLSELEGKEGK